MHNASFLTRLPARPPCIATRSCPALPPAVPACLWALHAAAELENAQLVQAPTRQVLGASPSVRRALTTRLADRRCKSASQPAKPPPLHSPATLCSPPPCLPTYLPASPRLASWPSSHSFARKQMRVSLAPAAWTPTPTPLTNSFLC